MTPLTNGTLSRIDSVAIGPSGDPTYTHGDAIELRVLVDVPTRAQRYALGTVIQDASAVVYVMVADVPGGVAEGGRVVVAQDGMAAVTYVVVKRIVRVFRELGHYELFCKEAS